MSDKTKTLRKDEFEFSQKMQAHFPWGVYTLEDLRKFNGSKASELTALWKKMIDEWIAAKSAKCFLASLYTTHLPAITGDFIVKERFSLKNKEVKFSAIGEDFLLYFGDVVEKPIGESELNVRQLQKSSVDRSIIGELGGSEARIFLQQIWLKMRELQVKGETDGWHVAYVEDKVRFPEDEQFAYTNTNKKGVRSVLRAVDFFWFGGGWRLGADLVSYPREWRSGYRFLSGNSLVA